MTATTPKTTPHEPENRNCDECGNSFVPARKWSAFCSAKCRWAYRNRMMHRGGLITPLVIAWNDTRHAEKGSERADICAYARRELTQMASDFIEEDRKEGRGSAVDYVRRLMASDTLYVDRRR